MEAMIFAAGLGTRLKPITDNCPKALVKINNKTLLEWNIEKLIDSGVEHIVVNVHHFAPILTTFIKQLNYKVRISISDETDKLLDTGGGLKKAAKLFTGNDHIIIQNVDILSSVNYNELYKQHNESKALATLAISNRKSSRYLLFDANFNLCGWENTKTNQVIYCTGQKQLLSEFAFSGIHVVSPLIFNLFPDNDVFSMIDLYLKIAGTHIIQGFNYNSGYWFDIGSPEKLEQAATFFSQQNND